MALAPSASPQSPPAVAVSPAAASPSVTPPSPVVVSSPPAPAPVSRTPPVAVIPPASSPPSTSPPPPSLPSSSPPPPSSTSNPPPPSSTSNPSPPSNSAVSPPPPSPFPPPPPSTKTTPSTPSSTTTSTTSSPSSSSSFSTTAIVGIAVAAAVVLFLVFICACCFSKKKRRKHHFPPKHPPHHPHPHPHHPPPPLPRPLSNKAGGQQWDWPAFPPSAEAGSGGNMAPPPPPPPPPLFPITNVGYGQAKKPDSPSEQPSPSMGSSRCWFTYEELKAATDNFSAANLLGQGGFGCVYKGTLPSGQIIAVKQLKFSGGHGEREFQAEVETISRVHHRHLVSLAGYCRAESQRLLVYEYVPNWTLEYHLHGRGTPVLSWKARQKIAIGAARGLAYLHEDCHPRIIHRDIKSSNILIDDEFEAQVADFGLAKFTSDSNTHVTTRVMGTFGYMAPEYASSGKLTEKSDVFSFGVVLLELISGRKPVDPSLPGGDESLVEWARPLLSQVLEGGNAGLVVDSKLDDYDEKEMMKMIEAAAACVRYSAHKRPRMGQVVRALEDDVSISELNKGVRPGQSGLYPPSHRGSSDYESSHYSADMKRFRQLALGSQEYASEEKSSSIDYQSSSREAERIATKPSQTPLKFTARPIRGGSSSTFGSNQSSSSHEMNV